VKFSILNDFQAVILPQLFVATKQSLVQYKY